MPIYQFGCEACGKQFEELVPYSRRDEVTCPDCEGHTRVLLSAFATKVSGGSSQRTAPAAAPRFT